MPGAPLNPSVGLSGIRGVGPFTVTTTSFIYDAFGRVAEENVPGVVTHVLYQPDGSRFATIQNGSLQNYFMPMVNGMVEVFDSTGEKYIRHTDWLGTSRLATDKNGAVVYDRAYAPYGETYAEMGSSDRSFTGNTQDAIKGPTGIYDFLFREHSAAMGRWLVPDPAGMAAVDITNPQTWNRYAYVGNNPLSDTDPLGLVIRDCSTKPCTGSEADSWWPANYWDFWGNSQPIAGLLAWEHQIEPPDRAGRDNGDSPAVAPPQPDPPTDPPAPNNGPPDKKSCASRLAAGVQKSTGVIPTNLQSTGPPVGGHANYTFDVSDPQRFQSILNQNMPWARAGRLDQGHRYGTIQSTHILDPLNGGSYSGHTDLFGGHSILAPLHWIIDVGIGKIPGVNLDFGCKVGS